MHQCSCRSTAVLRCCDYCKGTVGVQRRQFYRCFALIRVVVLPPCFIARRPIHRIHSVDILNTNRYVSRSHGA